jgi:hypothetical protein
MTENEAPQDQPIIQPTEDEEPAPLDYRADQSETQAVDPVTAPQTDPAAISEHERNLRQRDQYGA